MARPHNLSPKEIAAYQVLSPAQRDAFLMKTKRKRIALAGDILRR